MSFIIIFSIGTVLGLAAAFLVPDGGRPRPFINVAVSIFGALLGGILAARLIGGKDYSAYDFDIETGIWSVGGAILLLLAAKLLGRGLPSASKSAATVHSQRTLD